MTEITLAGIYRYPVKGLSGESRELTELNVGQRLANDRIFAISTAASEFDPAAPDWVHKSGLAQLAKHPRLAQLSTSYNPQDQVLTISRNGKQVTRGCLTDQTGKLVIENFLDAFLGDDMPGHPRIISAEGVGFTDQRKPYISIINLATVEEIARKAKVELDPIRFRGNLLITGAPAWAERNWIGKRLTIGPAMLEIVKPIERCAATSVNPDTAERDANIPQLLRRRYGHIECGIFGTVTHGGTISPGDPIHISEITES